MNIPALTVFAVVTALLPILNCAQAENATEAENAAEAENAMEEEDRSCEKRDKDAEQVGSKTVESCNYYCEPVKGSGSFEKKYYKDGTSCKYNSQLTSKCIENTCEHPDNPIYKKDKETNNKENKEEEKQNENERKEEVPKEDEQNEEKVEEPKEEKDEEENEDKEEVEEEETSTGTQET
ncbi:RNA polymerase II degradation factor 1-like [Ixodes scapularis]|uniref:RNA polymerase II degradation factor 1-like n=1 Tax=Ixodes scapularis TaxID=6945 RepID=UPI001C38827F|nr:RNA polymerase II degradation factor 1-like [Ixodes scapularis]